MKDAKPFRVCPVWLGYLLRCPARRWLHNPRKILAPHLKPGMHALDVGCAMGFFSLPMAQLVGAAGRVVCVDLQSEMIAALRRRAERAALADRIETRVCGLDSLGVTDLAGRFDFALAFAVVHEVPDPRRLFVEVRQALKPGGKLLIAEPVGHVREKRFRELLVAAEEDGFRLASFQSIPGTHAVLLETTATPA